MEDLITVIIPVYNAEKWIEKCIKSVINQTYKNLEIILVDDGSTDDSLTICNKFLEKDRRIKVIHTENRGVSSARNEGLNNSQGKWIAFVDADDWIEKNFCEKLIKEIKESNSDVALCGYKRVTEENYESINTNGENEVIDKKIYIEKVLNPQTAYGFCHMKIINRSLIENIRFEKSIVVGEDALFNLMIAKNIKRAIFIKEPLYNYKINLNSTVKKFDENYVEKYLKSMQIIKEYVEKNYKDKNVIQNFYNFIAFHVMLIAVNYCYHPDNQEKRKINLLKNICNIKEFKEGIKKSNYNNLSITRKITLYTLKHKLYIFTELICRIRQKQNRR